MSVPLDELALAA